MLLHWQRTEGSAEPAGSSLQLGFSGTKERFPAKATCLEIYSRVINAQLPLTEVLKEGLSRSVGFGRFKAAEYPGTKR